MTHTPTPWKKAKHSLQSHTVDIEAGAGWFLRISPGFPFNEFPDPAGVEQEFIDNVDLILAAVNSNDGLLEALEQAALELEEAANVLENSLPSLASIYQTAAENKRAAIKAAR